MVLIAQSLAAALQQPLVEAGLAQYLLVPLTVNQQLEDVGHRQLQIQSMLETRQQEEEEEEESKRMMKLCLHYGSTAMSTTTVQEQWWPGSQRT